VNALKRNVEIRAPTPPNIAILSSHTGMMPVISFTTLLNAFLIGT
jgi:hypothetical protein